MSFVRCAGCILYQPRAINSILNDSSKCGDWQVDSELAYFGKQDTSGFFDNIKPALMIYISKAMKL